MSTSLNNFTSTPPSSDDEDADEPSEKLFDATYSNREGSTIAGTETQYNSSRFDGLEIKIGALRTAAVESSLKERKSVKVYGALRTAAVESSLKERKSVKVYDTINPIETPNNMKKIF